MKKLIPVLFLIASCGEKGSTESAESGNVLENLTYSVDTLVVDAGGELLSIENYLQLEGSSSLSEDQKFFYVFNNKDHTLAVVDLDQLKLVEVLPFEKEGPDGVGEYIAGLQALPDGRFLITGFEKAGVFNREGKKLDDIPLIAEKYEGIETDLPIYLKLTRSAEMNLLFSFTGYSDFGEKKLVLINPSQKSGKTIKLPEIEKAQEFDITLISNQGSISLMTPLYIQELNGQVYVSNGISSGVYTYDYQADSMRLITFQHQLVPSAVSGTVKNEVSSREEFNSEVEKITTQIAFEKLLWDEKSNHFFRIGRKTIPKIKKDTPYKSEVYLFIYDENLNLLGEKLLEDLTNPPRFYFMKDGKLYSYVNVEDELGFAVFTFDFN
ncbi:DUF4221 family protein [Algoriphagus aquimarinus]|uniref:DUF4221 domain-containing protein n=1 Tax=Algoriphagus aquimarinus TaxID=237018 RepID=A0A5C7BAC3_9BACT|nr:DUF4221 family protein [Algoriphagus aquimarinus]TXE14792.1 DUF4221 domain-containing protein [Algoriphagus aquimarinus]